MCGLSDSLQLIPDACRHLELLIREAGREKRPETKLRYSLEEKMLKAGQKHSVLPFSAVRLNKRAERNMT